LISRFSGKSVSQKLKKIEFDWLVSFRPTELADDIISHSPLTRDVDVLVALSDRRWPRLMRSGGALGFVPRRAEALDWAHQTGVLGLRQHKIVLEVNLVFASLQP